MFLQLTQYSDLALLLLRLTVAVIFAYHALPKLKNVRAGWQAALVGRWGRLWR